MRDKKALAGGKENIQGIYYGNEFCEYHIPSIEQIIDHYEFAEKNGLKFVLVTPLISDYGANLLRKTFSRLESICSKMELVFNDYGAYHIAHSMKFKSLALGRILSRQKRDPRLTKFISPGSKVPKFGVDYFKKSVANSPPQFLKEFGISRVEIDNLLHGNFDEDCAVSCSLYYPWGYISMSRWCHGGLTNPPCNKDCCKDSCTLDDRPIMPVELYHFGNVLFFKNSKIPFLKSVDRLVYMPEPII